MSSFHRNSPIETLEEFLTVDELAALLKVSPMWVYSRVRDDDVPHIRLGKTIRFRKSAIDAWLVKMEVADDKERDE